MNVRESSRPQARDNPLPFAMMNLSPASLRIALTYRQRGCNSRGLVASLAVLLVSLPTVAVAAQPDSPSANAAQPAVPLQLNQQQRQTIEQLSDFALDQIDAIADSGFDLTKIDRTTVTQRAEALRQQISSTRPDAQQISGLRDMIRQARQQIQQQLEAGLTNPKTK